MTEHLPSWVMQRYAKLWIKFGESEFTKESANKVIGGDKSLPVLLSTLRKSGWLELRLDQKDARRSIYKLKDPKKAILEEIEEMSKK